MVTSIRRVDWQSLSTNFFVILSPGALDGAPVDLGGHRAGAGRGGGRPAEHHRGHVPQRDRHPAARRARARGRRAAGHRRRREAGGALHARRRPGRDDRGADRDALAAPLRVGRAPHARGHPRRRGAGVRRRVRGAGGRRRRRRRRAGAGAGVGAGALGARRAVELRRRAAGAGTGGHRGARACGRIPEHVPVLGHKPLPVLRRE